jgi:hypothetical protein
MRNELNLYLNSLDKIFKRMGSDFNKLCKGKRIGTFLSSIVSQTWHKYLILWRSHDPRNENAIMSAEKPSVNYINTAVVLVKMIWSEEGKRYEPNFADIRTLYKKCQSGSLFQARGILAGIDTICKEGVCVFILTTEGCVRLESNRWDSWNTKVE